MVSVTAKSRTISTGTPISASPLENNFVELYNNDATLVAQVNTNLANITTLQSQAIPTAAMTMFVGSTLPTGYVWANGRTIGASASGATGRANADTSALFTALWTAFANAELPIQDSTGAASTRGGSAAADFSANKRLPTPDLQESLPIGRSTMGGAPAPGRVTSASLNGGNVSTLGKRGGEQTHVQTVSELAAHTHTYQDSTEQGGSTWGGSGAHSPNDQARVTGSAGSSSAMNVMNPWIAINFIIKL